MEVKMEVKMLRGYKITQGDLEDDLEAEYFSGDQEVNITFNNGDFFKISLKNLEVLAMLWAEIKKPI